MNPYDDDAPTNVQGPPPPPPPAGRPLNPSQKSAIAAALVGTAALGGAAYGMARYLEDPATPEADLHAKTDPSPAPGPDPGPTPGPDPGPVPVPDPNVDTDPVVDVTNRDDLTFDEAFHASREDMGKGHYFEWHGQLYNTYYKDEWEHMSRGQQNDFLASVRGDEASGGHGGDIPGGHSGDIPGGHSGEAMAGGNGEIPPPPDEPTDTGHGAHNQHIPVSAVADISVEDAGHPADQTHITVADVNNIVVDESAEGDVKLADEPDVAVVEMDGQNVSVIDVDHDGHPDAVVGNDSHIVLLDTDHDHILDTQATYNPETHELVDKHEMTEHIPLDLNMDSLHQPDMHQESLFTSHSDFGTDFDNNADITDFAS